MKTTPTYDSNSISVVKPLTSHAIQFDHVILFIRLCPISDQLCDDVRYRITYLANYCAQARKALVDIKTFIRKTKILICFSLSLIDNLLSLFTIYIVRPKTRIKGY